MPRQVWKHARRLGATEEELNSMDAGLYCPDSIHLSEIGMYTFLFDLQQGLREVLGLGSGGKGQS